MEYLGTVTLPARSSDPSVNQRELPNVKSLTYCLIDVERRIVLQPDFDQRWTENRTRETARKMAPTAAQTSVAKGDMNERNPGFCFIGFLIMMLIPSSMNGALKSTTRSLALVMVMAPRATSVSWGDVYFHFQCFGCITTKIITHFRGANSWLGHDNAAIISRCRYNLFLL